MRLYTYVATGLAFAVFASVGVYSLQKWKYESIIARMKETAAESTKIAVKAAMKQTDQWQSDKDKALNEANQRAQKNQVAATRARSAADSLRDELAAARTDLSNATESARAKYAAAVETVLGECSRELAEMGRLADGHANDAVMLKESWPR